MLIPPLISDNPLETAIRALTHVLDVDDLRWLLAFIAIEKLDQRAEIRGIKDKVKNDTLEMGRLAMLE